MTELKHQQLVYLEGEEIKLSHPYKEIYDGITRLDYFRYLIEVAPRMLPFLMDRALTIIRYPHGGGETSFFQKEIGENYPSFANTVNYKERKSILCNNLPTLIWLANLGTLEFHIPYNKINEQCPEEIVFDLDPPSHKEFYLAIQGAIRIKEILERLQIQGLVKTSGSKGLQIHIPIPPNRYTYEDTRKLTMFIAKYMVHQEPALFTIERFKKNRGQRLYIDYLQHSQGKTIIAPYSTRGKSRQPLIAMPIQWDDLNQDLKIENYTLKTVMHNLVSHRCPFERYHIIQKEQDLTLLMEKLENKNV